MQREERSVNWVFSICHSLELRVVNRHTACECIDTLNRLYTCIYHYFSHTQVIMVGHFRAMYPLQQWLGQTAKQL